MQPLVALNHLKPGPQPKMKGVTQNNLRAKRLEHGGRHALYSAVSTHWHKNGGQHLAVGKRKLAGSGLAVLGLLLEKRLIEAGGAREAGGLRIH